MDPALRVALLVGVGIALLFIVPFTIWGLRAMKRGDAGAKRALDAVKPGAKPIRHEVSWADRADAEPGYLALYTDELVFVVKSGATRIALGDITDVVAVRAAASIGTSERTPTFALARHVSMPVADSSLQVEWNSGGTRTSIIWAVSDADAWVASLAEVR